MELRTERAPRNLTCGKKVSTVYQTAPTRHYWPLSLYKCDRVCGAEAILRAHESWRRFLMDARQFVPGRLGKQHTLTVDLQYCTALLWSAWGNSDLLGDVDHFQHDFRPYSTGRGELLLLGTTFWHICHFLPRHCRHVCFGVEVDRQGCGGYGLFIGRDD